MPKILKVFYIDDEPDLLDVFKDNFSTSSIEILTFTDPYIALEEIKKNPPDCIFLDFRFPKVTGDEIARKIPSIIPKFLISGDLFVSTQTPFNKIIQKPFRLDEIHMILDEIKKNSRGSSLEK